MVLPLNVSKEWLVPCPNAYVSPYPVENIRPLFDMMRVWTDPHEIVWMYSSSNKIESCFLKVLLNSLTLVGCLTSSQCPCPNCPQKFNPQEYN